MLVPFKSHSFLAQKGAHRSDLMRVGFSHRSCVFKGNVRGGYGSRLRRLPLYSIVGTDQYIAEEILLLQGHLSTHASNELNCM